MIENFVKIYDNVIDEKSCKGLIEKFEASEDKYETVNIEDKDAKKLYEFNFVLIRPDLMVAWRSNSLPNNPLDILNKVRGE